MASTISVLPAPVSPVTAVMPGPSTSDELVDDPEVGHDQFGEHGLQSAEGVQRRDAGLDRRLRRPVTRRRSPVVEAELGLEDLVEVARAGRSRAGPRAGAAAHPMLSPAASSPRTRPSTDQRGRAVPTTVRRSSVPGSRTSERSKSMWGDTGVSSSARCVGAMIGPRADKA